MVLDEKDPNIDKKIAERVILNHRYAGGSQFTLSTLNREEALIEPFLRDEEAEEETPVYEKFNPLLHAATSTEVLTRPFLRKYITYARTVAAPVLSEDAIQFLTEGYAELRQKAEDPNHSNARKLPVTVRTLETLIRIATAHAKLRLSPSVAGSDVEIALRLLCLLYTSPSPRDS